MEINHLKELELWIDREAFDLLKDKGEIRVTKPGHACNRLRMEAIITVCGYGTVSSFEEGMWPRQLKAKVVGIHNQSSSLGEGDSQIVLFLRKNA